MNERFEGTVLSIDTDNKRLFVESDANSTAIIFKYENDEGFAEMDLTRYKYRVAVDFNGIMTMSLPGQASADSISILEAKPLAKLSGIVSKYANEGFYLKTEDGREVRIQSNDFVELNESVTITYDDSAAVKSLSFTKN